MYSSPTQRTLPPQGLVQWQTNIYYSAGRVVVPAHMDTFVCQVRGGSRGGETTTGANSSTNTSHDPCPDLPHTPSLPMHALHPPVCHACTAPFPSPLSSCMHAQAFHKRRLLGDFMTELCGDDGRAGGSALRQLPVPPSLYGRSYRQLFEHMVTCHNVSPSHRMTSAVEVKGLIV